MELDAQLETKAGIPAEALVTHGDLMRAFEQFKAANDEQLEHARKGGDVLLEEKVARINSALDQATRRLDELSLKSARPAIGRDAAAKSVSEVEHKTAF